MNETALQRCWCCQNLLTSADIYGICRQCRTNAFNENRYKKMWEQLKERVSWIADELVLSDMQKLERKFLK